MLTDERVWKSDSIMAANADAGLKMPVLMALIRAIEAEVLQAQEPVAWMSPGKERIEFSRPDTVYGSHTVPLYAAPQPPAPCQCAGLEPVAWLHNERKQADVITSAVKKLLTEEKARYGFDSLMQRVKVDKSENYTIPLVRQSDAAAIIAELRAEIERLTKERDHWKANHDNRVEASRVLMNRPDLPLERTRAYLKFVTAQATIAQQAERIANLTHAIDEQMVSSHLGVFNDGDDPRVAINKLLCWSQDVGSFFAKERIAELEAELMAQKEWATCYEMQSKAEIASQAALIEKCEKALIESRDDVYSELIRVKEYEGYERYDDEIKRQTAQLSRHDEALAAIAAQKGVSLEPKASPDSSNHKTLCKQALKQIKDLEWHIKSIEVLMLPLDIDCSKIENGDNA